MGVFGRTYLRHVATMCEVFNVVQAVYSEAQALAWSALEQRPTRGGNKPRGLFGQEENFFNPPFHCIFKICISID